ncbi:aminopeptidase P N-terminal domain-containing protein [Candidatus Saccharibacteria bacterium]|jgi:Xaa-Pro aminopeptidase|nr:aminopeptidase P N-terminal domain-containing protein [Candidatus Saccharibacteria bacterium]MBP9131688.1 aminopeptidase P N-terminal domain-containing protein [Candidatus Saccharibacteria bacterium]
MNLDAKFYTENRNRLRDNLALDSDDIVIIPANYKLQSHSDLFFPFTQDSNFFYLTGINESDCLLLITAKQEWLLMPEESSHLKQWNGQMGYGDAKQLSGIKNVVSLVEGWQLLKRFMPSLSGKNTKASSKVYLPAPETKVSFDGVYANPAKRVLLEKLKTDFPLAKYCNVSAQIADLRVIKQQPEINAIQKAIDITGESMKEAFAQIENGSVEYEIEAGLAYGYRKRGASGVAYDSIVACGVNACVLHYIDNNCAIDESSLLLVDSGAKYNNYAADITRTFSINGEPSKRQQLVLDEVKLVHDFALDYLKSGVNLIDYEQAVEDRMGDSLKKLGLIKTANTVNIRKYFPTATSHFLGLDVHDVGPRDAVLEAGMVLTVEPGIYIPEESIGARLENNILITDSGAENLSSNIPVEF